ncbi:zinc finger protein 639-like isoform X1 [Zophobas morio]|uniref:zinc finger protein 639-like isoform X1 n=1 Tax=Zophobas morio TaxID=2755281 RepID=UPI003083515B
MFVSMMEPSSDYLNEITTVSKVLEEEEAMFESMNAELDKQVEKDMEEIQTYVIPDSPGPETPVDPDLDQEEKDFQSMNAQLDKQIAQDMEAIRNYIDKTESDSFADRIEFFNSMDSSLINNCFDKNVTNHILYQHTVLGTIMWHECNMCDYRAKEKDKLQEHMVAKHSTNDGLFGCQECSYKGKTHSDLMRHKKLGHRLHASQHQCDKCGLSFSKHYGLLRHMKEEHEVAAFPCQKCDFISVEESDLRQHVLAEHLKLNISWYKCAQCVYRTAKKVNLDRHIMYKHSVF